MQSPDDLAPHRAEARWRVEYAPRGYRFLACKIPFDKMEALGRDAVLGELAYMRRRFALEVVQSLGRFDDSNVFTRVTVYPKRLGESLAHLDPLVGREGIEVELRYPS